MPTSIDVTEVRFGQSCDAELLHEPIQGRAMKVIQFGPGALSLPNLIHRRHIGAAPGVDQSGPVGLETELGRPYAVSSSIRLVRQSTIVPNVSKRGEREV